MATAESTEQPAPLRQPLAPYLAELGCEVVSHAPGAYVVATFGPVVIVCLGREAGAAGLDAFSLANAQAARKHARLVHIVIFCEGCSLPRVEERQAVLEVLRTFQEQIAATSVVLEGSGLPAVLLGSIVRIVDLINQSRHPMQLFGAVPEAADYLLGELGPDAAAAADLARVVAEVRSSLG